MVQRAEAAAFHPRSQHSEWKSDLPKSRKGRKESLHLIPFVWKSSL